ncbi:MAG TPA: CHRD domain-containing protein [Pyrinomonadaceae bacterium]|nr:CHRD domain-containing protein [Pyrinomonadaceae bacterium]
MKNKLRVGLILAAAILIAVAATANRFNVRADHDDDATTFRARLSGFGEVPPKLVDGQGRFNGTLSQDKTSITWTISWTGLTGPAQAAHVHFGQNQVNGNVVVFFCGGGGRPACPDGPDHSGSVSGTWTSADILAVAAQNVSAGDLPGFLRILNANEGYANIHTTLFPGGEIRGQVSVRNEDRDDH